MPRINGANSDYQYSASLKGVREVPEEEWGPLELKVFICPHNQPSKLQAESDFCEGVDNLCPCEENQQGHALIHLHETEGIRLITDRGNQIRLEQNGKISFNLAKHQMLVNPTSPPTQIEKISENTLSFHVTDTDDIVIGLEGGAHIILKDGGDIALHPKSGKKVLINSPLEVNGTVTHKGLIQNP